MIYMNLAQQETKTNSLCVCINNLYYSLYSFKKKKCFEMVSIGAVFFLNIHLVVVIHRSFFVFELKEKVFHFLKKTY